MTQLIMNDKDNEWEGLHRNTRLQQVVLFFLKTLYNLMMQNQEGSEDKMKTFLLLL